MQLPEQPSNIYTFAADTSLLIMIAYVVARGRFLLLLFRDRLATREAILLGLGLGIVGLTEAIFRDARVPYATHTLFVTFAAISGGLLVGMITAAVVTAGAFVFQPTPLVGGVMLAVTVSAFLGRLVRPLRSLPERLIGGFLVGAVAQAGRLMINFQIAGIMHERLVDQDLWISVPANGFGVMLLLLVASDAQVRALSEQRKLDAERANTLLSQAQLAALRARVHPHFLFNAHNSVAALCGIAPERARDAILRLSRLMRRALEAGDAAMQPFSEELEAVRNYAEIEQERFGSRLSVQWEVDPAAERACVPPFALQTLVENAVTHGIAPKVGPGVVRIFARTSRGRAVIGVRDDGVGMDPDTARHPSAGAAPHGLQILGGQLELMFGRRSRVRVFSRPDRGALAVFAVPVNQPAGVLRKAD